MDKKFAIFDMDGTLIDSMDYWNITVKELFEKKGVTVDSPALLAKIKTMSLSESTVLLAEKFPQLGSPKDMVAESSAIMAEHYKHDVKLKDGVREYLEKLKSEGVRFCLATMSGRPVASETLGRLGIYDMFEFVITGFELGRSKNTPDIYIEATKKFGAEPEDVAVFEDAYNAVKVSKSGGFYSVAVYDVNEAHNWQAMKETADEAIESWRDLL